MLTNFIVVIIILVSLLQQTNAFTLSTSSSLSSLSSISSSQNININKINHRHHHHHHYHIQPIKMSDNSNYITNPPIGYTGPTSTPLLDTVKCPADLKRFDIKQLKDLSHELRWDVINAVSKVGGHLSSSLGVVELTVALHYIFNRPEDRIVWDVGHQAYPHKILTGRRERMSTLRQLHGLSGFTKRAESEYDAFGELT